MWGGLTSLDNATSEVRAQVFVATVNALRKGFTLGIAAGALAVALSSFIKRKKIALKALLKQGGTGGRARMEMRMETIEGRWRMIK